MKESIVPIAASNYQSTTSKKTSRSSQLSRPQ
jgi:hypothetical protein